MPLPPTFMPTPPRVSEVMTYSPRKVTSIERAIVTQLEKMWDEAYQAGWRDGVASRRAVPPKRKVNPFKQQEN